MFGFVFLIECRYTFLIVYFFIISCLIFFKVALGPQINSILTTGLAASTVDRGNPQVGGASVKDNFEGLGWSSDGDDSIVSQLEVTHSNRQGVKTETITL